MYGCFVQRMSVTIPELVDNSPSVTADGSVIIGGQSAALYYLDLDTGKLMNSFSSSNEGMASTDGQLGECFWKRCRIGHCN